jgi:hypothetical protein
VTSRVVPVPVLVLVLDERKQVNAFDIERLSIRKLDVRNELKGVKLSVA